MFYHWTDFNDFMSDEQARMVVKRMLELAVVRGKTMTGTEDINGELFDFSTQVKPSDTKVCFVMGIEQMGTQEPLENPVKIDTPTTADMMRALQEHNSYLQKQVNTYKGGLK